MEEIKVGEWVRTDDGRIYQVDNENDEWIRSDIFYKVIARHSENIIDLIEVGDVLKLKDGTKWEVQEHQGGGNWLQLEWENIDDNEDFFKKVDSIVTKEQFSSVEYRLQEGDK